MLASAAQQSESAIYVRPPPSKPPTRPPIRIHFLYYWLWAFLKPDWELCFVSLWFFSFPSLFKFYFLLYFPLTSNGWFEFLFLLFNLFIIQCNQKEFFAYYKRTILYILWILSFYVSDIKRGSGDVLSDCLLSLPWPSVSKDLPSPFWNLLCMGSALPFLEFL